MFLVATSKLAIFGKQRQGHLAAKTTRTQKLTEQIQYFFISFKKLIQFHSPTPGACKLPVEVHNAIECLN